jgi:hypothetical protein
LLADTLTDSRANGIAVDGKDVYVVGYTNGKATYWKNGVATVLGNGNIYGVAIVGKDVYMAGVTNGGDEGETATYWKNGVQTALGTGVIFSVTNDGSDIYMAGYKSTPNLGDRVATYWRDTTAVALKDTLSGNTEAMGIFVQDGEVYTAGSFDNQTKPVYWKNSRRIALADKSQSFSGPADAICVQGGNVYAAGYMYAGRNAFAPICWKNGTVQRLPHAGPRSFASAIAVQDRDVYVAGSDNYFPVYWKNGALVHLGDDRGQVFAMTFAAY